MVYAVDKGAINGSNIGSISNLDQERLKVLVPNSSMIALSIWNIL
jgi:hypothetical protein